MDKFLPPEIISIIREFAKPLFKFPKEYKEAMRILNRTEWPYLKKKLSTKDADQVLAALNIYTQAVIAKRNADDDHNNFQDNAIQYRSGYIHGQWDWSDRIRIAEVCRDATRSQTRACSNLMSVMYGIQSPSEEHTCTDTDSEEE
jgi:hypothetical protein